MKSTTTFITSKITTKSGLLPLDLVRLALATVIFALLVACTGCSIIPVRVPEKYFSGDTDRNGKMFLDTYYQVSLVNNTSNNLIVSDGKEFNRVLEAHRARKLNVRPYGDSYRDYIYVQPEQGGKILSRSINYWIPSFGAYAVPPMQVIQWEIDNRDFDRDKRWW